MEAPAQFMQEIRCPSCPQQGHATWEARDKAGGLRNLASLSSGFRSAPAQPGLDPVITCNSCNTVQPGQKNVGA
jgi:hypothetical protein